MNNDRVDSNGNILFPGAVVNDNSRNVIALPNSNSKNIILENCIVPEDVNVESYEDVLNVDRTKKEYFGKLKIKKFM